MGNVCSCECQKSVETTWDRLCGRPDRHNPAGKGPDGKVNSDVNSKYNKNPERAKTQTDVYGDPNAGKQGANYNPDYYKIVPKTNVEEKPDPQDPEAQNVNVSGKVVYDPKNEIDKKPVESQEQKAARLEHQRKQQEEELERIRKRTEADMSRVAELTKQPTQNQYTNVKPVEPATESKTNYQMVQPNAPAGQGANKIQPQESDWGEAPKKIQGLSTRSGTVFDGATLEGETKYAHQDIVIENSQWREIHKGINCQFYDSEFPADLKSLKGAGIAKEDADKKKLKEYETYKFQRLSQIQPGIQVIVDGISPTDIFQGGLGNCYYLSALASAAENSKRIERNILQRTNSTKGAYCVSLCITGCWVPYVLDDIFPVRPDGLLPFCYTKNKEMWAMLFEKAYAKAFGAYWHIGNGGTSNDALRDLTGAPTIHIDLKEAEEEKTALQRVTEADGHNFIMNVSSKGKGESKSPQGIIQGHAYTLSAVKTLSNGVTLLKLRNPWGKGEWTGNWGDNSNKWTPQLKKEAGWTEADDGTFFLTYEDFKSNFDGITICYYHDNYYYSYLQSQNPDEHVDMKQFTVDQAGEYYVGASQPSKFLYFHDPKYEYGFISIVIVQKMDDGSYKFVEGFGNDRRDPWCKVNLQSGTYLALIYTNWNSANTTYTFWTYGVKNTVIKRITDEASKGQAEQILVDVLTKKALADNDNWTHFSNPKIKESRYKFEGGSYGYGFYIFDNKSPNLKVLEVGLSKTSTNCEFVYPQKGGESLNIKMGPGDTQIAIYRIQGLPNQISFSCQFKMRAG